MTTAAETKSGRGVVAMETMSEEFTQLPDHRRANSSYELVDVLRSAFAMFLLKSPSLLAFKELTSLPETAIEPKFELVL
jgi:hypothetical protein